MKLIIQFFVFIKFIKLINNFIKNIVTTGDWGLGIGDWGLGIGDWAQSPIPNSQSPIPNPPRYFYIVNYMFKLYFYKKFKIKIK